jgi:IS5 family transposase
VAISHFLKFQAQAAINTLITKPIQQAVCDRGYVGVKEVLGAKIILPKKALKRDNRYQRDKKRKLDYC